MGVGVEGRARGEIELAEDIGEVALDRGDADKQCLGDLAIGAPAATSRSTSNSRGVSPWARPVAPGSPWLRCRARRGPLGPRASRSAMSGATRVARRRERIATELTPRVGDAPDRVTRSGGGRKRPPRRSRTRGRRQSRAARSAPPRAPRGRHVESGERRAPPRGRVRATLASASSSASAGASSSPRGMDEPPVQGCRPSRE